MCISPPIVKINSYINGSEIYFSNILPFSTEDINSLINANISLVISFQEEIVRPYYFNKSFRAWPDIRHYYYTIDESIPEQRMYKLFDTVYSNIYLSLIHI